MADTSLESPAGGSFSDRASPKVQLDIDDAPFLMEEAPPPVIQDDMPLEPAASDDGDDEEERKRAAARKKRLILVASLACILLIGAAGAAWWFFMGAEPTTTEAQPEPKIVVVPSSKEVAGPAEFKIAFAPFMVEQRDGDTVRFLQASFTGIASSQDVIKEAEGKQLILRDAIYYYLRNKTHEYLLDSANAMTVKEDLQNIVNQNLNAGKLDDILLVNYIVK